MKWLGDRRQKSEDGRQNKREGSFFSVLCFLSSVICPLFSVVCPLLVPRAIYCSEIRSYIEQLQSSDEDKRYEAVVALGELADPEAASALEKMFSDPSMSVRHQSAEALAQIGGRAAEDIFLGMLVSSSVEKRRLGAIGLGLIGCGEDSFQRLLESAKDENWQVRWASGYALGALGDMRAKVLLEEMAQADAHQDVRDVAQRALQKLGIQIRWYHSLPEALKMSKGDSQNLFVFFQIPSSTPCKIFTNQILKQLEVIELSRNFLCVRINPKSDPEVAQRYEIRGVPTLLFLSSKGERLDQMGGLTDPQNFSDRMKQWAGGPQVAGRDPAAQKWILINQHMDNEAFDQAVPLLEDFWTEGKITPQILLYLGYSYGKLGNHEKSIQVLERLRREYPDFEGRDKGLYCLALSCLALGRLQESREILEYLKREFDDRPTGKSALEILAKIDERRK